MHKILEEMKKNGGKWLGAARNWMQWYTHNGDRVAWNSEETLIPHLTVRDVEDVAAHAAAAARYEALLEAADLIEGKDNKDNEIAIELRKRAS